MLHTMSLYENQGADTADDESPKDHHLCQAWGVLADFLSVSPLFVVKKASSAEKMPEIIGTEPIIRVLGQDEADKSSDKRVCGECGR